MLLLLVLLHKMFFLKSCHFFLKCRGGSRVFGFLLLAGCHSRALDLHCNIVQRHASKNEDRYLITASRRGEGWYRATIISPYSVLHLTSYIFSVTGQKGPGSPAVKHHARRSSLRVK